MKTIIYDTELNEYSRKYLVTNSGNKEPSVSEFVSKTKKIDATLFESFLLFDTTAFKVYGENIPMAYILNRFGVKGTEALIEQDAFKFILWNQMVTYIVDEIPGIDPLQTGFLNSPAHSDPEESIKLGFNWMSKQPRQYEKNNLIRKIRDRYSLPDKNLSGNAVSISKSAYESGKLRSFGLIPEDCVYRELDESARKKLCHCTESILQYLHLLNNNMSSYTNFEFYQLFNESNKRIHDASKILGNFNHLAKIENIPDLIELFTKVSKPFEQIIKLRDKSSSIKFRSWLSECSHADDANEITKEYVDSILNSKGFFQTKKGRLTKNIAMSVIGAGVGAGLAGPIGAIGGAGIAKQLIEPAADLGLDLLDEFVLSGLTKGWTPRMFFDDISKLE